MIALNLNHFPVKDYPHRCYKIIVIRGAENLKLLPKRIQILLGSQRMVQPSLQEDGLPKSVSSLTTWECSLLKQSCQNPEGEDWGKD